MNVLYLILVLLVVTRVFAELAERVRIPAIVGELVAGVALGLLLTRYSESCIRTDVAQCQVEPGCLD